MALHDWQSQLQCALGGAFDMCWCAPCSKYGVGEAAVTGAEVSELCAVWLAHPLSHAPELHCAHAQKPKQTPAHGLPAHNGPVWCVTNGAKIGRWASGRAAGGSHKKEPWPL
jgi:hypothetical protein